MAARFRTNMTMMRILMTVKRIVRPVMVGSSSFGRRGGGRGGGGVGAGVARQLRADLLELRPRRLEAQRPGDLRQELPGRLAVAQGLEALVGDLADALRVDVRARMLGPRGGGKHDGRGV